MASKNHKATWMGQYRADNASYVGGGSPIRTAGAPWYHSYLGFDKSAILSAMNSSSTTPRVILHTYVTNPGNFVMGMHKEASNKATSGLPFYRYARVYKTFGTGWNAVDITDISLSGESLTGFKNILNAGFTAPVWYGDSGADQGEAYGCTWNSYHVYIEIQGTWNTKPGIPTITSPTSGIKVDGTFELKGNHASDSEQSSSQLRYEWAINDGTGWTYLGFGPYGVVNKVVDFSGYAETEGGARVGLRANDGSLTGDWAYSGYFTISHNKPPGAPTVLSPIGGAQKDRTQDITFSWTHNDADGQSAYDFRWREQGATTWNESGKIVTTSKTRTVAANTFPQATIEWQVRTFDQEGLVGPYSSSGIFNATEPSNAPTITDPTSGDVVPTARISMSWSAPEQTSYQVELVQGGAVVWTQEQASTTRLISVDYDLVNNTEYTLRLRTKAEGELYSAWDSVTFSTSFTPPAQPLVELQEFEHGAVHVQIDNPIVGTEGEPTVVENEVYRRVFGVEDSYIRIAENVPNNGVFIDYTPASGVTYEYVVRARGDNDTFTNSGAYSITVTIEHSILALSSDPTRFVVLELNPSRSFNYGVERNLMQFNGRKFPVAEFGYNETLNTSLSFSIQTETDLEVLIDIIESKETLLYRDVRGRRDFVTADGLQVEDQMPTGYRVSFSIDKVDYIEGVE